MAGVVVPRIWTRQPQFHTPLNTKGSHWKGLAFLMNAALGPYDFISRKRATTWNRTVVRSPSGIGLGSTGLAEKVAEWDFSPVVGSGGGGNGDVTYVVFANPIAEARESCLMGIMMPQVSPYRQLGLFANFDTVGPGAPTSGMLAMESYMGGGGLIGANAAGVIDGKFHVFAGVHSNLGHAVYVDGKDTTTASSSPGGDGWLDSGSRISVGSESYNSATRAMNGQVLFAAAWNRTLSPIEILAVTRNIWAAWAFPTQPLYFGASSPPPSGGYGFIKVGGSWKTLSGTYVKVAGVWKSGHFSPKVSGAWKTLV